jgi:MoxR-like ATPase
VLSLDFKRIQFTPDLMPADITGTEIIQEDPITHQRAFKFLRGPLFANVILADEINRTPPKTQSALLEAMQEHRITAGGHTYDLEQPFFVLATQNPIEQEGTYPLPEAQLDRFMFMTRVDYPTLDEELEIVKRTTAPQHVEIRPLVTAEDLLQLQALVRRVPVADHVFDYAIGLVRATRPKSPGVPSFVTENVSWGAGPRAGQYLILGAKARAVLNGRTYVTCEDVRQITLPVLRHRLCTNYHAESKGVSTDNVTQWLLEHLPTPTAPARNGRS